MSFLNSLPTISPFGNFDATPAWKLRLRPASFRGIGFKWDSTGWESGRRLAVFEFAQRDKPFVEDLGRRVRRFPITGYVIGPNYMDDRDKLIHALQDIADPGTLIHPYFGLVAIPVYCETFRVRESQRDGGMAIFEMLFCESSDKSTMNPDFDTTGFFLDQCDTGLSSLGRMFADLYLTATAPNFIQAAAIGLVHDLAGDAAGLLGISGADLSVGVTILSALGSGGGLLALDEPNLADNILAFFPAIAAAVSEAFPSTDPDPAATFSPTSRGLPPGPAFQADPSFGLSGFSTWGNSRPIPANAQQAQNQAAFIALVQGAAVIANAQLFANTDFASSVDAFAARDAITGAVDAQELVAGAIGADDLYQAWDQVYSSAAADLTARALAAPGLISYATPAPLPSLVLSQRLYQTAGRSDELVSRNAAVHPAFMPPIGKALAK